MDLESFLTTTNLTLSDRLQEAQYNSEGGFQNVWVVLAQLAYHRENSGGGCWPVIIWLHDGLSPRRSYLGLYIVYP